METGKIRHGSGGRDYGFGRRLCTGALGAIVVGGAIVMGGAATLVTAFANTGSVKVNEDCSNYSATVTLDNNVQLTHWVEVVSTIPGFPGFAPIAGKYDTSYGQIYNAHGSSPQSGTVTLNIYLPNSTNNNATPGTLENTSTGTLKLPSDCTSTIRTTPSAGGVVGTAIHDSATVSGTTGTPTGTVVFKLFAPSNSTCSADGTAAVYTSPAETLSAGKADSGSYITAAVGTYHWVAAYSGDTTYKASTSNCADETATTSQAAPTIATTASAGGVVPVPVSDSATVSGGLNPTGTVTFSLYSSSADCTAGTNAVYTSPPEALASGKASSGSFSVTTAGTYQWVAKYSGDANNKAASSACGDEPVTTTTGGTGGVQAITTPSTGSTGSLTGITVGGFLLLGGLGVALMGAIIPRRRRTQ